MSQKKRSVTFYSKARGSDIATGCEITEYEKRNGKTEGRVALRFFISDNSKEQIRFVCEPHEAYSLFFKINKVARSAVACKEQTLPHKIEREDGGKKTSIITSVTVEKWVRENRSGYAIVGSRTIDGKNNSFNVAISDVAALLYYGDFLKFLSCAQAWETIPDAA
ncbi:hypothetical protein [Geomonas subterranea]|uniref:hypothetical protein n=1 Tax=Geomonas subterranea TaxID=2847989 RepID=UPI001CD5E315|nr:hypothetical protein [Geomonas fuzhouensis]